MHRSGSPVGFPLSDETEDCNGGNGRLDVYVGDFELPGVTKPYSICTPTAAWIELSRFKGREILAHEMFHAIQKSYPLQSCVSPFTKDYRWWVEASAEWAIDYVYPDSQLEHELAPFYLRTTEIALDVTDERREYGAYLLPFFVQRSSGSADFVRVSWENSATQPAIEALDKALPGGFAKIWPDFAKRNWNQKPVDDYQKWDDLAAGAKTSAQSIRTSSAAPGTLLYDINYELPLLSASYHHFIFPDDDSSIIFWNGVTTKLAVRDVSGGVLGPQYVNDTANADDTKGAHITALILMNGAWNEEDWTDRPWVSYCRDLLAERIDELVLIVSNSEFKDRNRTLKAPGLAPVVYTSNMGCWRWSGKATASGPGSNVSTDVTWTRADVSSSPFLIQYNAEGIAAWSVSVPDCNASGSVPISTSTLLSYNFVPLENAYRRSYDGTGITAPFSACGSPPSPLPWFMAPPQPIIPGNPLARFVLVSPDGKTMDDFFTPVEGSSTWTWHFEAQRQ